MLPTSITCGFLVSHAQAFKSAQMIASLNYSSVQIPTFVRLRPDMELAATEPFPRHVENFHFLYCIPVLTHVQHIFYRNVHTSRP